MNSRLLFPVNPIVMVDDEPEFLRTASFILRSNGYTNIKTFDHSVKALEFLMTNPVSLVCLDFSMPELTGKELLSQIISGNLSIPVLMITAYNDIEIAVDCIKSGALDFITKPIEEARFMTSIKNALELFSVRHETEVLKESILKGHIENQKAFEKIVTQSEEMYNIFQYAEAIAKTPLPVLIGGETGVGKELMACAIHEISSLNGDFVPVNVAGLDAQMFSDTLFGHSKGAFTGADKDRSGLIEKASGGSLFLDEIGDLSLDSQVKLLRLLQENQYFPLGSDVPKRANVRIITATNRDLACLRNEGKFRSDLFFRLQAHEIRMPSLRQRKEDISILIDHFLDEASSVLNKKRPTPPSELYTLLENYPFPGNIRELRGLIYDAVTRHTGGILSLESFREKVKVPVTNAVGSISSKSESDEFFKHLDTLPTLKNTEDRLIKEALRRSKGNISMAAGYLGISRQALSSRLKREV